MKRVAITGGRGRMAPAIADFLRARGWAVELFSRVDGAGFRAVRELTDPSNLGDFNAVLHLGWSSVPLVSEEDPGIEDREDYPLARALASAAAECSEPPLVVFSSSAAVYGNTSEEPAREDFPCRPLGRYAAAKLGAEKILAGAPRFCALRITNVIGVGGVKSRPQGIIPRLIEACGSGNEVTVWGDGTSLKDYLAASDLNEAVLAVLENQVSGIFNVASGHTMSVNQLIALVEEASGRPMRCRYAPHYAWDVERAIISSAALRERTGWAAARDPVKLIAALLAGSPR